MQLLRLKIVEDFVGPGTIAQLGGNSRSDVVLRRCTYTVIYPVEVKMKSAANTAIAPICCSDGSKLTSARLA